MDDERCQWKKDWPEECQHNVATLLYNAMLARESAPVDEDALKKFCQAMERVTFVSSDTLDDYIANVACLIEGKCLQRIGPEEKDYLKVVTDEILDTMSLNPAPATPIADEAAASEAALAIPDLDLSDIPDFVNSAASLDDIEMTLDSLPENFHLLDDANMT